MKNNMKTLDKKSDNKSKKSINKTQENLLDKIPVRAEKFPWKTDENNLVVIEKENVGVANRIAQKLIKKPKISYIHLEEFGSFVWRSIDGKTDIAKIGQSVKENFGDKAEPLYERLTQYFKILEDNGFIYYA